jgi:hypothetical protein
LSIFKPLRRLAIGAPILAIALSVTMFGTTAANATGLGGTAVLTGTDGVTALTYPSAGTTPFDLNLGTSPANDCSADSATGSTTFYSYMAPQYTNPGTETVSGGGVTIGNGIYANAGTGADGGNHNVAPSTGQVPQVLYSFSKTAIHVTGGIIPAGQSSAVYEVGILCWNSSTAAVTDWWNAECTFTGTSASYTFSCVPGPPSTNPNLPEAPLAIALPIGGAAAIGAGVFFTVRRRRKTPIVAA